MDKDQVNKKPS